MNAESRQVLPGGLSSLQSRPSSQAKRPPRGGLHLDGPALTLHQYELVARRRRAPGCGATPCRRTCRPGSPWETRKATEVGSLFSRSRRSRCSGPCRRTSRTSGSSRGRGAGRGRASLLRSVTVSFDFRVAHLDVAHLVGVVREPVVAVEPLHRQVGLGRVGALVGRAGTVFAGRCSQPQATRSRRIQRSSTFYASLSQHLPTGGSMCVPVMPCCANCATQFQNRHAVANTAGRALHSHATRAHASAVCVVPRAGWMRS